MKLDSSQYSLNTHHIQGNLIQIKSNSKNNSQLENELKLGPYIFGETLGVGSFGKVKSK